MYIYVPQAGCEMKRARVIWPAPRPPKNPLPNVHYTGVGIKPVVPILPSVLSWVYLVCVVPICIGHSAECVPLGVPNVQYNVPICSAHSAECVLWVGNMSKVPILPSVSPCVPHPHVTVYSSFCRVCPLPPACVTHPPHVTLNSSFCRGVPTVAVNSYSAECVPPTLFILKICWRTFTGASFDVNIKQLL